MSKKIRTSIISDAQGFIEVKQQLKMPKEEDSTASGGFLLGTNLEMYQFYIQNAYCLSLIEQYKILGFGIVIPDKIVRASELWEKRKSVDWKIDIKEIENLNICYFEQLAFLKGNALYALTIAYNVAIKAFETHDVLLTTTVKKPISNVAAIPYILAGGGQNIGNIDEVYPDVGDINSNVFMIKKEDFLRNAKQPRYANFFKTRKIVW